MGSRYILGQTDKQTDKKFIFVDLRTNYCNIMKHYVSVTVQVFKNFPLVYVLCIFKEGSLQKQIFSPTYV